MLSYRDWTCSERECSRFWLQLVIADLGFIVVVTWNELSFSKIDTEMSNSNFPFRNWECFPWLVGFDKFFEWKFKSVAAFKNCFIFWCWERFVRLTVLKSLFSYYTFDKSGFDIYGYGFLYSIIYIYDLNLNV